MKSLNSKNILFGYRQGIFPMAEEKMSQEVFWVKPKERLIIPIGRLHISRSLKKFIKASSAHTTINTRFTEVVERCADRPNTWINDTLFTVYHDLFKDDLAASIEIWKNENLIGGLFGVIVGSCFCGESMFSAETNGSKLALVVTMARLNYNKFQLFDAQFPTSHLLSMGGKTISQKKYEKLLSSRINEKRTLLNFPEIYSWSDILQLNSHKL